MRCRAEHVFAFLATQGYEDQGDRYETGMGLLHPSGSIPMLPMPDLIDGDLWFEAEIVADILANRWVWQGPLPFPVVD